MSSGTSTGGTGVPGRSMSIASDGGAGSGEEGLAVLGSVLVFPSKGLGLAAVGDSTFFFFLILMPGTGAELRASRKPRPSIGCGGMIFTLISLVALGVVLSGLYFFSAGGVASPGAATLLSEEELSSTSLTHPLLLPCVHRSTPFRT